MYVTFVRNVSLGRKTLGGVLHAIKYLILSRIYSFSKATSQGSRHQEKHRLIASVNCNVCKLIASAVCEVSIPQRQITRSIASDIFSCFFIQKIIILLAVKRRSQWLLTHFRCLAINNMMLSFENSILNFL